MSWVDRYIQSPPAEERPVVSRVLVPDTTCPACGSDDVRRYPIANQHGPRMTIKCQACLHILSVSRCTTEDWWPPFRPVTWDWQPSISERASRELLDRGIAPTTDTDAATALGDGA